MAENQPTRPISVKLWSRVELSQKKAAYAPQTGTNELNTEAIEQSAFANSERLTKITSVALTQLVYHWIDVSYGCLFGRGNAAAGSNVISVFVVTWLVR